MPILNIPARAAMANARPPMISGVEAISVSAICRLPTNAPSNIALYAAKGSSPVSAITTPPMIRATMTAAADETIAGRAARSREGLADCAGSWLIAASTSHPQSKLCPADYSAHELSGNLAFPDHKNPVGETENFSKVKGNQQHPFAFSTRSLFLLMDGLPARATQFAYRVRCMEPRRLDAG